MYKSYQHTSIKLRQVVYTCIVHVQNSSIDIYSRRAINNKQVHPHRYLLLLLLLLLLQLHTAASTAYCCYGYVFVSHLPLICATIRAPINRHTRSRTIDRPFDFRCSIESGQTTWTGHCHTASILNVTYRPRYPRKLNLSTEARCFR